MPTLTDVYENNKVLFWGGGILAGGIIFFVIQSQKAPQGTTLETLHLDLQDIDRRLAEENAYLSSSASMSPVSPEIDIGSIGAQEYESSSSTTEDATTAATSSSKSTSAPKATKARPGPDQPQASSAAKPASKAVTKAASKTASKVKTPTKVPAGVKNYEAREKSLGSGPLDFELPMGMGPGEMDFAYGSSGSIFFPGDSSDYWGLN